MELGSSRSGAHCAHDDRWPALHGGLQRGLKHRPNARSWDHSKIRTATQFWRGNGHGPIRPSSAESALDLPLNPQVVSFVHFTIFAHISSDRTHEASKRSTSTVERVSERRLLRSLGRPRSTPIRMLPTLHGANSGTDMGRSETQAQRKVGADPRRASPIETSAKTRMRLPLLSASQPTGTRPHSKPMPMALTNEGSWPWEGSGWHLCARRRGDRGGVPGAPRSAVCGPLGKSETESALKGRTYRDRSQMARGNCALSVSSAPKRAHVAGPCERELQLLHRDEDGEDLGHDARGKFVQKPSYNTEAPSRAMASSMVAVHSATCNGQHGLGAARRPNETAFVFASKLPTSKARTPRKKAQKT